jgi:hypothetical protein
MRAVRLVYRAELRRRWRSWLALALLVSLAGGSVLAALVASQRTSSAFPSFTARYGYDDIVATTRPEPGVATLPEVASADEIPIYPQGNVSVGGSVITGQELTVYGLPSRSSHPVMKLLAGRLPLASQPTEVLAPFTLAQRFGVHIGSILTVPFYSSAQAGDVENDTPVPPDGPLVRFVVVGIEATLSDFPLDTPSFSVFVGPGFEHTFGLHMAAAYTAVVRLRTGRSEQARFSATAQRLVGSAIVFAYDVDPTEVAVQHSIEPQVVGWALLALLVGLTALAVVGQALARQNLAQSESYPTLRSLGYRPKELFALGVLSATFVGLLAAVGALGLAWALSPLTPVGLARIAAPSTGFVFDPVLLVGAAAILLICVALGALAAWRSTRALGGRRAHTEAAGGSSVPAAWRVRVSALPSVLVGTRRALQRGRGRARLPVGTALLGSSLAVTALMATGVFGASLSNLTATPSLYGQGWQLFLRGVSGAQAHDMLPTVEANPAVNRVTLGTALGVQIRGVQVQGVAVDDVRGTPSFPVASGHLPNGDGQIALGTSTLHQAGAHIGSIVPVLIALGSAAPHTVPFEVVGTTSFAPSFGSGSLGVGALLTIGGAIAAVCDGAAPTCHQRTAAALQQPGSEWGVLISVVPGSAGHAALALLSHRYATAVNLPVTPSYLVDFGQAVDFPLLLGIALALFGAATFTHLLVASVARRRRDIALLKALGFVRRQIAAAVCWQATTVAVVAVGFGTPVGIALGRLIWRAFASNIGAVPVPVTSSWLVAALAGGVLVAANLLAVIPAFEATRLRPSEALRQV